MPFTPKDWQNEPSHTTPLSAEAIEDMETRLSAYTDAREAAILTDARVTHESLVLTDPRWAGGTPPATDGTGDWLGIINALKTYNSSSMLAKGGKVVVPPGQYGLSAPATWPGTVTLEGPSFSFAGFGTPGNPNRGAVFVAMAGFAPGTAVSGQQNGIMQWSGTAYPPNATSGTADEDETGGGARYIVFDGRALANGPQTLGRRSLFEHCWSVNPLAHCYLVTGQNCRYHGCIGSCKSRATSNVFWVENWDNKIEWCEGRDWTAAAINARPNGVDGLQVLHGHYYSAGSAPLVNLVDTGSPSEEKRTSIHGVTIDNVGSSHLIKITATGSSTVRSVNISDLNILADQAFDVANTYSVVFIDAQSGSLVRCKISDCMHSITTGASDRRAWVEKSANAGTVSVSVTGCYGEGVRQIWADNVGVDDAATFRPSIVSGCVGISTTGSVHWTERQGTSTQSGNGATTAFTVAHSLGFVPGHVNVVASSANARGDFHVTKDATNITITYATAPVTGTNNLVWMWRALA